MVRKNEKETLINYENSIFKSNEISMSKLNQGLSLNQMQLLAYAIYSTQQNGKTEFHKADFEKKFEIDYKTEHAKQDSRKLFGLEFSIEDLQNDYFEYWHVFASIKYQKGLFTFKWCEEFVPHILELKEKYITTDLTITSQFKSGFSWTLYDYLKAHYGYWHKTISKEGLMRLFGVEDKKTYKNNTGRFKTSVLDVAIAEINQYTELEVRYVEEKEGRSIVGFDLIWSNGSSVASASKTQIKELAAVVQNIVDNSLDYVDLQDGKMRERAKELIQEVIGYQEYTVVPISITKERADFLLLKVNSIFKELEDMKQQDKGSSNKFYNWLDDRE